MKENEWTFAQINTFLESNMLFFLERGSLIEMSSQLRKS